MGDASPDHLRPDALSGDARLEGLGRDVGPAELRAKGGEGDPEHPGQGHADQAVGHLAAGQVLDDGVGADRVAEPGPGGLEGPGDGLADLRGSRAPGIRRRSTKRSTAPDMSAYGLSDGVWRGELSQMSVLLAPGSMQQTSIPNAMTSKARNYTPRAPTGQRRRPTAPACRRRRAGTGHHGDPYRRRSAHRRQDGPA